MGYISLLIILMKSNLWTWTSADGLHQLTHSGYIYGPIISPDGTRIAYKTVSKIDIPHLRESGGPECSASDFALTDLWMIDLKTQQIRQIASQPGDMRKGGLIRSSPSWSPDGEKLTWTEGDPTDHTTQFIIYDLVTGSQVIKVPVVPDIRPEGICWVLPSLDWADGGLALKINNQVVVYDIRGQEILRYVENQMMTDELSLGWVSENEKSYLGLNDLHGCWHLLDPTTKEDVEIGYATMELYSLLAGSNARYTVSFQQHDYDNITWKIVDRAGIETNFPIDWEDLALDPTGQAVAFTTKNGVFVRQGDVLTMIPGTEDILAEDKLPFIGMPKGILAWGALSLRVKKRGDTTCAMGG